MEDITIVIGQYDYVLGVDDLLEEDIHYRLSVGQQIAVLFHLFGQPFALQQIETAAVNALQPIAETALPGHFNYRRQYSGRH